MSHRWQQIEYFVSAENNIMKRDVHRVSRPAPTRRLSACRPRIFISIFYLPCAAHRINARDSLIKCIAGMNVGLLAKRSLFRRNFTQIGLRLGG